MEMARAQAWALSSNPPSYYDSGLNCRTSVSNEAPVSGLTMVRLVSAYT